MLDDSFFIENSRRHKTTYPVLAGKIKMAENLFLYLHALLVGY